MNLFSKLYKNFFNIISNEVNTSSQFLFFIIMNILFLLFISTYKDIDQSCYSDDGKTLNKVTDQSPYLRISAKCETIGYECFCELKSLIGFSFEENPNSWNAQFLWL